MSVGNNLLLKACNIVDVISGEIYTASIKIQDGYITGIIKEDLLEGCEGFELINCRNKWVLPGLIDMHVHIKDGFAPLFVASGITTVRNTGGNVIELKDLINAPSDHPTPRIYSADRIIDGPPGLWGETSPWSINIDEPKLAREEVRRQVSAGADFIKVYGWLSKEVMETVVDEAKRFNKEVSCDLIHSKKVNAIEAGEIGIKWNEHASGLIQAMYPGWNTQADQEKWSEINWLEPDIDKIREVCIQLLELGIILCPTMTLFDQMDSLPKIWKCDNQVISKIYENKSLISQWENLSQYESALKAQGKQSNINKAIAKTYFDLGGTVVAGTDTPAGVWTFPGMALHRELELFVQAGFSEINAIRTATSAAARAMNNSDIGIIKEGTVSDLLILNSNPLLNIKNTRDIDSIIKGGKLFSQNDVFESIPSEKYVINKVEKFVEMFKQSIS